MTRSDQYAFMSEGIPSLLILEGGRYEHMAPDQGQRLLYNWEHNFYHTPFDDLNQQINLNAVSQHIDLIFRLVEELANSDKEPQWNADAPFRIARLQTIAEKR